MGKGKYNKSLKLKDLVNKECLLDFSSVIVEWERIMYGIFNVDENKFSEVKDITRKINDNSKGWYFMPRKNDNPLRLFLNEINFPFNESGWKIDLIINPKTIKSETYGVHPNYLNKFKSLGNIAN